MPKTPHSSLNLSNIPSSEQRTRVAGKFILARMLRSPLAMAEKKNWGHTVLGWFVVSDDQQPDLEMPIASSIVDAADARLGSAPLLPELPPHAPAAKAPAAKPKTPAPAKGAAPAPPPPAAPQPQIFHKEPPP